MSGGLDSTALLYDLAQQGHKIHCLLFDYGQKHSKELCFAKLHCKRVGMQFSTFKLPQLRGSSLTDGTGGVVVPNRNAVLLSMGVALAASAGADTVTIGANLDDAAAFPDCRPEFISAMNAAVASAGLSVEICGPYLHKTKTEIVEIARRLGVCLDETWSCYLGDANPCGGCDACRKREMAIMGFRP